ncbi:lamin tail domain-containing protein [Candidatus Pacearchaeota archaeon]|nr:lamin tail domain-containing protein [Candidatus Pacearchaeota archaeon]
MKKYFLALAGILLITTVFAVLVEQQLTATVLEYPKVLINEFTVDPQTDWDGSGSATTSDEWVELYNTQPIPIDLTSWTLVLNDSTDEFESLIGIIPPYSYLVIYPDGSQNNDGQLLLYDNSSILIDAVAYGDWDDGNTADNAPDGNANNITNECLSRLPNAKDTNTDNTDFTKLTCTYEQSNNAWNMTLIPVVITDIPSIPFCLLETDSLIVSANITGSIKKISLSYSTGGAWKEISLPGNTEGIYSAAIPSSELNGKSTVSWKFVVENIAGDLTYGTEQSKSIAKRTLLSISPSQPDGQNNWYITEPTFTLENPDASIIEYRWNGNFFIYSKPFKLEGTPNNASLTGGISMLKYWSDVCSGEPEQNQTFHFDFTSPIIEQTSPTGQITKLKPTISAYIDEKYSQNSGINISKITIKLDNADVTKDAVISPIDAIDAAITYSPVENLSVGQHEVTISAEDKAGRNSQLTWTFEIVKSFTLKLAVDYPESKDYNIKRIPFNLTTSEQSRKIEYINYADNKPRWQTLCSNCDSYGAEKIKTKILKEGWNNLTIRAIGEFSTDEKNISIFIDSKAPVISKTEPARNKIINGSFFRVKYTEENPANIKLFWNPNITLQNCTSGRNQVCSTSINLSNFDDQLIDYYFEISDGINTVKSKTNKVFVDTTSPRLAINLPQNETVYRSKVPFNLTVSEKAEIEYFDISSGAKWIKLCSNCDSYGAEKIKYKRFSRGNHNILISATDKAGNSDVKQVFFTA